MAQKAPRHSITEEGSTGKSLRLSLIWPSDTIGGHHLPDSRELDVAGQEPSLSSFGERRLGSFGFLVVSRGGGDGTG